MVSRVTLSVTGVVQKKPKGKRGRSVSSERLWPKLTAACFQIINLKIDGEQNADVPS